MDSVLADTLKANLKNAATEEAKLDALVLAMIAVVDCQLKTADRVKSIVEEREREKKENISRQTIEVADKVVDKQMRIVQEIASLLGETAAETKIALTKLKESIINE